MVVSTPLSASLGTANHVAELQQGLIAYPHPNYYPTGVEGMS
jgi:hypothetical protein